MFGAGHDHERQCLLCRVWQASTLFVGPFCSKSCEWIYWHRKRLGYYVPQGDR